MIDIIKSNKCNRLHFTSYGLQQKFENNIHKQIISTIRVSLKKYQALAVVSGSRLSSL